MAKQRRNISISEEAQEILDREHVNASGLIDDLVRAYGAYGSREDAVEFAASKREEVRENKLTEAIETLGRGPELDATGGIDPDSLDKFNDGILNWSSKLEIPPEELVELVEHYNETGEIPEVDL